MENHELQNLLPWRHPFLMIDRMLEVVPHRRILTLKQVSGSDPVLGGRTTSGWFPAVLLLEGMGQSAALLFRLSYPERSKETLPMLGFLRASWSGSAQAGDSVTFDVSSVKMTSRGGVFDARALCRETVIAEAQLAFQSARAQGLSSRDERDEDERR